MSARRRMALPLMRLPHVHARPSDARRERTDDAGAAVGAPGAARSLRIVLFAASFSPRIGGVETAVARLAQEFRRTGHHVTVVTNRYPRYLPRVEQIDGITVYRILFPDLLPRRPLGGIPTAKWALLLPLAPVAFGQLVALLRVLRPQVINVHYLSTPALYATALTALRLVRARLIVSCHGSDVAGPLYAAGSARLTRWVLRHADALTACSAALSGRMAGAALIPETRTVHVVHNGSDAREFVHATPFVHPRPYILSVGRLTELKGMDILIEALGLLRGRGYDCDLIIAGAGPDETRLRRLTQNLHLAPHVYFDGPADRGRLATLYHGCAVFALASRWEAFGLTVLEAASAACPIVGTRIGGIPEIIRDGETGLLARPRDPSDMAEKLAIVLQDPARAARLGQHARAHSASFGSWSAVAGRYLDLYTAAEHHAPAATAVPILMYHQVAPPRATGVKRSLLVTPRAFAAQMRLLHLLGWRSMRLSEVTDLLAQGRPLPRRRFVLTFDDAFVGVLQHAAPILMAHGFTATAFVPTDLAGTTHALDGGCDHRDKAIMNWEDLRTWRSLGFDVGAHTRTHARLTALTGPAARSEISGAAVAIAHHLGVEPTLFAYPYGAWNPDVAAIVRTTGYAGACTTEFGRSTAGSDRYALPRISVSADIDLVHFAYRVLCADRIARKIARSAIPPLRAAAHVPHALANHTSGKPVQHDAPERPRASQEAHLPTLSVLIATYNRADLLDRTLRSLLKGVTERPDEIVVVNGGHDHATAVIARYQESGAPIVAITTVNQGLSHSQNVGYPHCRGEVIATLDDDVMVAPDWCRRVKQAHATYPGAGGIGGCTMNEFPRSLVARFEQTCAFDVPGSGGVRRVRTVAGVNMSYKRAVMEAVGPFDEHLPSGMDVDYNWRVTRAGYDILYDPSIVLTHHNRTRVTDVLRQQVWYGRGYYHTRQKWRDLPSSRIPRHLRGWKEWAKVALFLSDPFIYHPITYARRATTARDRVVFAALSCAADACMKAGFLSEANVAVPGQAAVRRAVERLTRA